MSFATLDDLSVALNKTFIDGELAQAQWLLDSATEAIKLEAAQSFEQATTTALLEGTWSPNLELPERPVIAVTSVRLNGVIITPGNYEWNSRQILRRGLILGEALGAGGDLWSHKPGAAFGSVGHWGGPASTVEVTYEHGYTTVPAVIQALCVSMVKRLLLNPAGVMSEQIAGYAVRYDSNKSSSLRLDEDEKKIARAFRQP